jgi:hypothetical protein
MNRKCILFIAFTILLICCVQQVPKLSPTPSVTPTPSIPTLQLDCAPMQPSYLPGEEVKIKLTLENKGSKPVSIRPFPPEIRLIHPSGLVRSFSPGNENLELEPKKSMAYVLIWDQRDESGLQVRPGYYFVEVRNIHAEGEFGSFVVYPKGGTLAKVLIQFPQGSMEKIVEVNQSQTVNGAVVTLERVELYSIEGKVQVLFHIPDLSKTSTPPPPIPKPEPTPPEDIWPIQANYKLDGSEQDLGSPGIRWVDNNIRLTWYIDPIPSDAKEMTFVITRLGVWEGPWEFRIKLG